MGYDPSTSSSNAPAYDALHAGDFPITEKEVTIPAGAALTRGAVMGRITANGQFLLSASAAVDGSQTPVAILMQDVAVSGAARVGVVAFSGEFNATKLSFGAGHTAATVEWPLRQVGIFLKAVMGL